MPARPEVSFAVFADEDNNQFNILVNGSNPSTGPLVFGADGGEPNLGGATITVGNGAVITITNLTSTGTAGAVDLVTQVGGTNSADVNAWIVIEQLNGP